MESDNLLERLKQKATRPSVPPREDGFGAAPTSNEESQDSESNFPEELNNSDSTKPIENKRTAQQEPHPPNFPVISAKGRLIRLESQLQEELLALCHHQGLTLELFVEAAFVTIEKNERLLQRVVTEAHQRKQKRKQAAMVKRIRTLSQKYPEP